MVATQDALRAQPFCLDRAAQWAHLEGDERRRQEAMLEVVSTEASYYARLGVIHEVFYQPSDGLLTRAERGAIFQNIDELLLRSGLFLDDLQGRQRNERGCLSAVSDIFLAHLRHFDCFRAYCIGHAYGSLALATKMQSSGKFAKWIKERLCDPRCSSLDLTSFLLEPVQRVARYPLLLKQILHYTAKGATDHDRCLEAVLAAERLITDVNESVRRAESELRLLSVQENLLLQVDEAADDAIFQLVGRTRQNVNRVLLLEGRLVKGRSKKRLLGLLLSDMLVLLLEHGGGKYALYRPPYLLEESTARPLDAAPLRVKLGSGIAAECCFELCPRGGEGVVVAAETVGECKQWVGQFERAKKRLLSNVIANAPVLSLPCIGTVCVTVERAAGLPRGLVGEATVTFCALELNNQRVELSTATGMSPQWHQSQVLSMASFDDSLRICLCKFHKYSPNEVIGIADISLNFLEYYNERSTSSFDISLASSGTIAINLQFRPA